MQKKYLWAAMAVMALGLAGGKSQAAITSQSWGVTADNGRPATLYTLTNANGMQARITNYGGILVSLKVPGPGGLKNVVQGFDSLADYTSADYLKSNGHYGSIIGRFANRIHGAAITLDGKTYTLDADAKGDMDQGGTLAYFRQVFDASAKGGPEPSLVLRHTDPDGFMGFPERCRVTVTYTLTRANALRIDMRATTDKKTVINMINHSYFSLAGGGTIDGETLQVFAHHYTPIDDSSIPTGEIRDVAGTVFDFTHPTLLGPRLASSDPQIAIKKGLDHNFVIDGAPGTLRIAARLQDAAAHGLWKSGPPSPACRSIPPIPFAPRWPWPRDMCRTAPFPSRPSITRTRRITPTSPAPNWIRESRSRGDGVSVPANAITVMVRARQSDRVRA